MNCLESKKEIRRFDLLIAEETEFCLTADKVYVAIDRPRSDLVTVLNDNKSEEIYSIEYFRFYNGERVSSNN